MNINYRPLIFIQKHYSALMFCWMFVAATIYILLINVLPWFRANLFLDLLFLSAAILSFFIAVPYYMKAIIDKINSILLTDCDPRPYISIYRDIINRIVKMERPSNLTYMRLSLSTGLVAAGEYNEAYEVIKTCKVSSHSRRGNITSAVYYNNLLSACIKPGLTDEAENSLESLVKCMALMKPKDYGKYENHLKRAQYSFNIMQGIYDDTESFFTESFDTSKNNYERVASKFSLAKVYLHSGDTSSAKEALEYIVAHGNKLHIVEEAKERLAQIE